MAKPVTARARPAVPRAAIPQRRSVPEDESADPVGPVPAPGKDRARAKHKTGTAKAPATSARLTGPAALAQQKTDFTAEGAPPPGQAGAAA